MPSGSTAMYANSFFLAKYGLLRKGPSNSSLQDDTPLSQLHQAPIFRDRIIQGGPVFEVAFKAVKPTRPGNGNRRANCWRFLCYFLHVLLIALYLILLVVATSSHAEHRIVMPYSTETSTRLRAGLQAFYTVSYAVHDALRGYLETADQCTASFTPPYLSL